MIKHVKFKPATKKQKSFLKELKVVYGKLIDTKEASILIRNELNRIRDEKLGGLNK